MPRYVSLINWTDQGIKNFKDSVNRADAASQVAEKFGGKILETYWTLGQYDVISVAEFPDDESGEAYLLAIGSQGNVRTTTLRAFDSAEMSSIISRAGG
jgi:uncharacterized protein with GYD domain